MSDVDILCKKYTKMQLAEMLNESWEDHYETRKNLMKLSVELESLYSIKKEIEDFNKND